METYLPADIRNFALTGHASSGKTLLSEMMLLCSGAINRAGSIEKGTTVSDYHEDEREHQISVYPSILHTAWRGTKLNIIDTPGYLDFISESLGALRIADSSVIVVHAEQGPAVGTEYAWEYATEFGIPKIFVINASDREHADFDRILTDLREHFSKRIFPMTVPVNSGPEVSQFLDIMRSQVMTYHRDRSGRFDEAPVSRAEKERVDRLHYELLEHIAESDDSLLEQFFEQGGLSEEALRGGIHTAIQNQSVIPLFCTSAERNIGVTGLMDFVTQYGSSPLDRAKVSVVNESGSEGESEVDVALTDPDPVVYVHQTISEAHVGSLSCFRLYSGTLNGGRELYNSNRKAFERIGQIYLLNGHNRESVTSLNAGDIGAMVKLKDTHTGDTLCPPTKSVRLPPIAFPEPNIQAALKFASKGDEDKVGVGLATLHEEDPTFTYHVDPELHQTVISGQGELHLRVLLERLKRRYKVEAELTEPRIPYRETIKASGDAKFRHKKQSGGAGQFAEVWIRIEPQPKDAGIAFSESLVGQSVDRVFVPSVERGVRSACQEGILAGYPIVDVKVEFYDGKTHPVDSNDVSFQIAGKQCFREAFLKAEPCLLEPFYKIKVRVPEESMGNVVGDLSNRRGKILGMDSNGAFKTIYAFLPQKELYQYSTALRSLTGGKGRHSEVFSHYEEMARHLQEEVTNTSNQRDKERV